MVDHRNLFNYLYMPTLHLQSNETRRVVPVAFVGHLLPELARVEPLAMVTFLEAIAMHVCTAWEDAQT